MYKCMIVALSTFIAIDHRRVRCPCFMCNDSLFTPAFYLDDVFNESERQAT
ncbi:hypothetical protein LguiB_026525 [Lonicera macranthoides]